MVLGIHYFAILVLIIICYSFSDGVGRTGTFICLHSQLEQLKTEGVVDIFQAVKSARIQRAGLIADVVSCLSVTVLIVFRRSVSYIYSPS